MVGEICIHYKDEVPSYMLQAVDVGSHIENLSLLSFLGREVRLFAMRLWLPGISFLIEELRHQTVSSLGLLSGGGRAGEGQSAASAPCPPPALARDGSAAPASGPPPALGEAEASVPMEPRSDTPGSQGDNSEDVHQENESEASLIGAEEIMHEDKEGVYTFNQHPDFFTPY
ncbi:unnamed protein product [Pleuronectes platessa]|uniref:Uncharacterized protein n=1 Tax=Pleuronectes platessa TaxID=8262 RepID=A0A9N7URN7_PLEPL|nr:unnamed protein product [Pleuronectes platessa]